MVISLPRRARASTLGHSSQPSPLSRMAPPSRPSVQATPGSSRRRRQSLPLPDRSRVAGLPWARRSASSRAAPCRARAGAAAPGRAGRGETNDGAGSQQAGPQGWPGAGAARLRAGHRHRGRPANQPVSARESPQIRTSSSPTAPNERRPPDRQPGPGQGGGSGRAGRGVDVGGRGESPKPGSSASRRARATARRAPLALRLGSARPRARASCSSGASWARVATTVCSCLRALPNALRAARSRVWAVGTGTRQRVGDLPHRHAVDVVAEEQDSGASRAASPAPATRETGRCPRPALCSGSGRASSRSRNPPGTSRATRWRWL